jgi:hemolysin III
LALAANILLPAILFCALKNRKSWLTLALCLTSFAVAVAFRLLDRFDALKFMPQGTHFLWHIFGGICGFFLIKYIYLAEDIEIKERKGKSLRRNHE